MLKIIVFLLAVGVAVHGQNTLRCPQASGLVVSGQLTFARSPTSAQLSIPPASQTLTYNHTLPQPFTKQPGVAVSLSTFSSDASPFLMLTVKPLPLSTLSVLSLLLRFHQKYLTWQLITVHFLAEDRADIEADYYQIDTRSLGTNRTGKAVQFSMPISTTFTIAVATYYLHGFELVSLPVSTTSTLYTPFEVTIAGKSANKSSIGLVVSTASSSQILSMLVSYVAFENSTEKYKAGILQFDSGSAGALIASVTIPQSPLAVIHGVSGFTIGNLQAGTSFRATLANSAFSFAFTPNVTYLNYHYFAVPNTNDPCYFCQGLPYDFNGTCVAQCLNGAAPTNGQCTNCPAQQKWNGTHCVLRCSGGQTWNPTLTQCQCPSGLVWNGNSCISCPAGQTWNTAQGGCACPNPTDVWTGLACETITCGPNQEVNPFTLTCDCIPTAHLTSAGCVLCSLPNVWNGSHCQCAGGQVWTGNGCANCSTNEVWNSVSNKCECMSGTHFNGVQCIVCQGEMVFNSTSNTCACPSATVWNGTNCTTPCSSPLVYTNGQCLCPSGTPPVNNSCTSTNSTNCSAGQLWDGSKCVSISCSAGFIFNGSACIQYIQDCAVSTYWNGLTCVTFNINCPGGSVWNGTFCQAPPTCQEGTYLSGHKCLPFPLLCLPYYTWNGSHCLPVGSASACPATQLYNGSACLTVTCTSGRVWSSLYSQCICNATSFWNGLGCISCPVGQIYTKGGCNCPVGYFLVDNACFSLQEVYCSYMGYASWNGSHCVCNPGFTAVGTSCLCEGGLITNSQCDPCYKIPHSVLSATTLQCQCLPNFYLSFGQCKPYPNTPLNTACPPGTLNHSNVCVPCSSGCLSCTSQTVCIQCRPQFTMVSSTQICMQNCGDGLRFTLPCDDGNNLNGDGCSLDCRIQPDYTCYGGSPNSKDYCTKYLPSRMVVGLTGTAHLHGAIMLNLKTNYLPANLSDRAVACSDLCRQILEVSVTQGDVGVSSIKGEYFPGSFSFSYMVEFGREPIGQFTVRVAVNAVMASIYFPNVVSGDVFTFRVNPAFLAIYTGPDLLQ